MQFTTQGVLPFPPAIQPLPRKKKPQTKANITTIGEGKETAKNVFANFFVWCFILFFEGQGRGAYGIIMRRGEKAGKKHQQILMHDTPTTTKVLYYFIFFFVHYYYFFRI